MDMFQKFAEIIYSRINGKKKCCFVNIKSISQQTKKRYAHVDIKFCVYAMFCIQSAT